MARQATTLLEPIGLDPTIKKRFVLHAVGAPQNVCATYPFDNHYVTNLETSSKDVLRAIFDHTHQGRTAATYKMSRMMMATGDPWIMGKAEAHLREMAIDQQMDPQYQQSAASLIDSARYFLNSYEACHESFFEKIQALKTLLGTHRVLARSCPIANNSHEKLSLGLAYIKPRLRRKNLVVLLADTHGIEGHWGSAQMRWLLDQLLAGKIDLDHTGVILVHGYNAWGFKHGMRVFENGDDPNRGCPLPREFTFGDGRNINPDYRGVSALLNPSTPYEHSHFDKWLFYTRCLMKAAMGAERFAKAAMMGQNTDPMGFSYVGSNLAPQLKLVADLVTMASADYDRCVIIDPHTGYGEKGHLTVCHPGYAPTDEERAFFSRVFGDQDDASVEYFNAETGGTSYPNMGSVAAYLASISLAKQTFATAIEMGTLENAKSTFNRLWSLYILSRHIQLIPEREGAQTPEDDFMLRSGVMKLLNPHDIDWRAHAVHQGGWALTRIFEELGESA